MGMFATLQIIIMFPLLNAKVPANAEGMFGKIAEIAAFDYYDISQFTDEWLELVPTDPVNSKLEAVGFETKQYINSVGTFSIILIIYAISVVVYMLTLPFRRCSTLAERISKKVSAWLFWNTLISAVMETVLIIAFVTFIKMKYHMSFETFGEKVESWMTIGTAVAYILVIIVAMVQTLRNFDSIQENHDLSKHPDEEYEGGESFFEM